MMITGILLILVGFCGVGAGMVAFGDIGIACMLAGITALLSGIGFLAARGRMKKLEKA